jgi:hypothetical protein
MKIASATLEDFSSLFSGLSRAHGEWRPSGKKDETGKSLGEARTIKEDVTEEHYQAHLDGKIGLGVIPINSNSMCAFSVIDIDDYSASTSILSVIRRNHFPLVPFRSKSGGLHLYLFFSTPEPAKESREILSMFVRLLLLPNTTEIFPKQEHLDENSIGNWINIPYFNSKDTDRFLYKEDGSPMTLEEATAHCVDNKVTISGLKSFFKALPLSDAPPCLQGIYLRGHTNMRNHYLFSQAVYLKSKFGEDFETKLMEINGALDSPLSIKEVNDTILNSLRKKDYGYKCTEEPICSICDKQECRKRKFGIISAEVPELNYEQLSQYLTDPPYYEWLINGKCLRFYSELDIINQTSFRPLCMRTLHILPIKLKEETWTRIVNTALSNMATVKVDQADDISIGALFRAYLVEFLTKRAPAANREQILMDRVFRDEETQAYLFRAKNLVTFLVVQKAFRAFGQTEIQTRLLDMGGKATRMYVNKSNTNTRLWSLPYTALEQFLEPDIDQLSVDFLEETDNEQY